MSTATQTPFPLFKCCYLIRKQIFKAASPADILQFTRISKNSFELMPEMKAIVDIKRQNKKTIIVASSEFGAESEVSMSQFLEMFDIFDSVILRNLTIEVEQFTSQKDVFRLAIILNSFDERSCENLKIHSKDETSMDIDSLCSILDVLNVEKKMELDILPIDFPEFMISISYLHIKKGEFMCCFDVMELDSEVLIMESSILNDTSFNKIIKNWMENDSNLKYMEIKSVKSDFYPEEDEEGIDHLLEGLNSIPTKIEKCMFEYFNRKISCEEGWEVTAENGKKATFMRTNDSFILIVNDFN